MFKKILPIILVLTLILGIFAGCTSKDGGTGKDKGGTSDNGKTPDAPERRIDR